MGAWGDRPFENDAALDWLAELGGIEGLRETLDTVAACETSEYLDADDGHVAVAAAELVAALLGEDVPLPSGVRAKVAELRRGVTPQDAARAVRALERVLGANSELASLWDYEGASWTEKTRALVGRLAALESGA